jgi:hypothetical protein
MICWQMTRPVFIIHALSHATAVVRVATELGRPALIKSAPGLATTLGPEGFLAILEKAGANESDLTTGVLDCGIEAGTALGALRRGVKAIAVDLNDDVKAKIVDIARQQGAEIVDNEDSALDLLDLENMDNEITRYILNGPDNE